MYNMGLSSVFYQYKKLPQSSRGVRCSSEETTTHSQCKTNGKICIFLLKVYINCSTLF